MNKLLKGFQIKNEVLIEGEDHKYKPFWLSTCHWKHLNAPTINKSFKLVSDIYTYQLRGPSAVDQPQAPREREHHAKRTDWARRSGEDADIRSNGSQQPSLLLRKLWFHVILLFCRGGREVQRRLKEWSFKFDLDASGRKYVTMAHNKASKNHPCRLSDVPAAKKRSNVWNLQRKRRIHSMELSHSGEVEWM